MARSSDETVEVSANDERRMCGLAGDDDEDDLREDAAELFGRRVEDPIEADAAGGEEEEGEDDNDDKRSRPSTSVVWLDFKKLFKKGPKGNLRSRRGILYGYVNRHSTPVVTPTVLSLRNVLLSTATSGEQDESSQAKDKISVTFVYVDGSEKTICVPVGMSMLEAAHENDIELEGACEGSLACSTCHVKVMDVNYYYNKLEDPTYEENDILDLACGLTETSACQVIAKPELDGMRLAIPRASRNFMVDGYVPKPH
ncbi:unnamed protein product [Miscanthus lutarioriparius]|uniref:2Fe-2S ferredoxin-type domain-containing protein n=1 Tax=Miscanthus lutarioriparius TaxID=422564 RepID=A0A811RJR1_9POAL|nr:unnamed protein product [Miscanthus lutarioriparius]